MSALKSLLDVITNPAARKGIKDVEQVPMERYKPPRGVPEASKKALGKKKTRQSVLDAVERGVEAGGHRFYDTRGLRAAYITELGLEEGDRAFNRYMSIVAATSPRSRVPENVRNASYYSMLDEMPEVGTKNPAPYGHLAQRLHQQNLKGLEANDWEWDIFKNPKPASFTENLRGNLEPVTVDTHAYRLPNIASGEPSFLETAYQSAVGAPKLNVQDRVSQGFMTMKEAQETPAYWRAQPKKTEYGAYEDFYRGLSDELRPAETQAAAWSGGGDITGLQSEQAASLEDVFLQRAVHTARTRGISTEQAIKEHIRGVRPLLGVGAAVGAMDLLAPDPTPAIMEDRL